MFRPFPTIRPRPRIYVFVLALLLPLAGSSLLAAEISSATGPNTNSTFSSAVEALGMLVQVVNNLQEKVQSKDLSSIHSEDVILNASLAALLQERRRMETAEADTFSKQIDSFAQAVARLHLAGDTQQQLQAQKELAHVNALFTSIKRHFSESILNSAQHAANTYVCPAHSDVIGQRGQSCPKCGAPLDQMARILPAFCGLRMPGQDSIRSKIILSKPLVIGQQVTGLLQLSRTDGSLLYASDLLIAHGARIHLFIIDGGLTDYHHEHPQPAGPGRFSFPFVARKPGDYYAWAEIRAQPIGFQEYAAATIPGPGDSEPLTNLVTNTSALVDGLRYELLFDREAIYAGRPIAGRLRVRDSTGKPFAQLEPVMEAFVHLVGFYEDRKTVLHIHPKGGLVLDAAARGGPEVEFQFLPPKPGFVRFFAQTQIDGKKIFVLFGVRINP